MTVHKLASMLFLLLTILHMVLCRKKLTAKRCLLLLLVMLCFVTGVIGMIIDGIILLALHKVLSMAAIFFLAIHLFVYRHKMT